MPYVNLFYLLRHLDKCNLIRPWRELRPDLWPSLLLSSSYLPFHLSNTDLLRGFLVIVEPLAFAQINGSELGTAFCPGGEPLSIRLKLDKLKTAAVKLDYVLSLRSIGLRVGFRRSNYVGAMLTLGNVSNYLIRRMT